MGAGDAYLESLSLICNANIDEIEYVFEKKSCCRRHPHQPGGHRWDVPSQTLPTGVPPHVYLTAISFFVIQMINPSFG